ncbi:hexose kinase [Companilactobacillus allii]|uniref:Tagatose-6-phosphate kinase n=1 Tax=Companilactobacillus allii TaxID=1847728 RepID=A0A1P8Q124_9LACO|nr:hexose kinase [Companilactobacillus allii]APX71536.1 hypothetical protein BTM29_02720 [Companilactobacillus allii]USQ68618.1 hexose kinase [Companilactobacillus allii]
MILTVTMNPSVDILYRIKEFKLDNVNRTTPKKFLGGKGVNAARVSSILGEKTLVTGFIGGFNGKYFSKHLNDLSPTERPMKNEFVYSEFETRNCITIMHDTELQTEINEMGFTVNNSEIESLYKKIEQSINSYDIDIIVLSGSLPKGTPNSIYFDLMKFIKSLNTSIQIILDTSDEILKRTIELCSENNIYPDAVKPNLQELQSISNLKTDSIDELINSTDIKNIPIILVSKGSKGCFAKIYGKKFSATVPKIIAINPTGSGDATVGALAYALQNSLSNKALLKCCMTAGLCNTLEENIGYISKETYNQYYSKILIKNL